MSLRCPNCGSTDKFDIEVSGFSTFSGNEDFIEEGDEYNYSPLSHCRCVACGYADSVVDFRTCAEEDEDGNA